MAKKDKFAQMQQGGGVGSFQETLVQAATTVAAIERQQEQARQTAASASVLADSASAENGKPDTATLSVTPIATRQPGSEWQPVEQPKFMRLPNPQIPLAEYNMVSQYCASLVNMTRQDFVELAIVEKLHALALLSDDNFNARQAEIRNRPPRGQRKGTKQTGKQSNNHPLKSADN